VARVRRCVAGLHGISPRARRRRIHWLAPSETYHRIDADEFYRVLDGVVIDDTELFNDKLQETSNLYSDHECRSAVLGALRAA
jgi:hypothetical protein